MSVRIDPDEKDYVIDFTEQKSQLLPPPLKSLKRKTSQQKRQKIPSKLFETLTRNEKRVYNKVMDPKEQQYYHETYFEFD